MFEADMFPSRIAPCGLYYFKPCTWYMHFKNRMQWYFAIPYYYRQANMLESRGHYRKPNIVQKQRKPAAHPATQLGVQEPLNDL